MIELDMYFYFRLGSILAPLLDTSANWPIQFVISVLTAAREELITFEDGTERARAFPKTADVAVSMRGKIDEIIAPIDTGGFGQVFREPPPLPKITKEQAQALRELCRKFSEEFQQESQHSYVLKVEDQRIFSAYVLVEEIEKSVSPETWIYMSRLARREIYESGRCLAVERYTAAGFHVLRCVESIIREYIAALGVILTVADRNWGAYVRHLKDKSAGHEAVSMVDNLRNDDRNTLMHPEKFLDRDEAVGLFCLCLTALDRLIKDMKSRGMATEFRETTLGGPVTVPLP